MGRKSLSKNYSKRHANERIDPQDRCRVYRPSIRERGMSTGDSITSLRIEAKTNNCYPGFASDSTQRVHIE